MDSNKNGELSWQIIHASCIADIVSRNPGCLVPWGMNSLLKLVCTLFLCRIIISHYASNRATIPYVQFFVYRWCFFILIRMPANTSISSCELCLSFIHGFSLLVELLRLSCVKLVPHPIAFCNDKPLFFLQLSNNSGHCYFFFSFLYQFDRFVHAFTFLFLHLFLTT